MSTIRLNRSTCLSDREIDIQPIRAQGPGGQNVNKVESAVQLRFDVTQSGLPETWKARLLKARDRRINRHGIVVIKAQRYRTREANREDAIERLRQLILKHVAVQKARKPTQPTRASQRKRLEEKSRRGKLKATRRAPAE